jgi:hypothetical protein
MFVMFENQYKNCSLNKAIKLILKNVEDMKILCGQQI